MLRFSHETKTSEKNNRPVQPTNQVRGGAILMTKQLFIVHPGTGSILDLSDKLYLVDSSKIPGFPADFEEYIIDNAEDIGYRLDNFNMTNLFFGGAE